MRDESEISRMGMEMKVRAGGMKNMNPKMRLFSTTASPSSAIPCAMNESTKNTMRVGKKLHSMAMKRWSRREPGSLWGDLMRHRVSFFPMRTSKTDLKASTVWVAVNLQMTAVTIPTVMERTTILRKMSNSFR